MTTWRDWMTDTLDADQIRDLAEHGADAGWPGLTYYSETSALYEAHEREIWERLYDDAEAFGYAHPLALIASFGGAQNVGSDATFRNLLVWYMAEAIARDIVEGMEEK